MKVYLLHNFLLKYVCANACAYVNMYMQLCQKVEI